MSIHRPRACCNRKPNPYKAEYSRQFILVFVLIAVSVCGCSSTRYLRSPMEANHRTITDHADIVLRSGERIEAAKLLIGKDTTRFINIDSVCYGQIETKNIERLIVTDNFRGMVGGLLAGGVGGFGGGILVGRLSGISSRGEQAMGLMIFGAGGMALGGVCGALYGGMRGYQQNYVFPRDTIK